MLGLLSSVKSLKQEIKLNRVLQEETNLSAILIDMVYFAVSMGQVSLVFWALSNPGGNLNNTAVFTPDPNVISQTQSLSEPLKAGDEIVVENAEGGLLKWKECLSRNKI